jgi:hypothetical protein
LQGIDLSEPADTIEHPQSAPSIDVSLVPAYRQCGSPSNPGTSEHSPPLAVASCDPVPIGAAHFGPSGQGVAHLTVIPGNLSTATDEADVGLTAALSDVRSGSGAGSDYNPRPSGTDATLVFRLRLTDSLNGTSGADDGTTSDVDFSVPIDCSDTTDPDAGADCGADTTADAVMPGVVSEDASSIVQVFRVRVLDAGSNQVPGDSDDRLFAQQGIFAP